MKSNSPIMVSVCICTYQRLQLKDCLNSIAQQKLPNNVTLRIVVVDNSPERFAAPIIDSFRANYNIDIAYRSCMVRNLSLVRNDALGAATGDYIVLVDDDEIVSEFWLKSLIDCSETYNADVVIGPVFNRYSESCPHWLSKPDLMARAAPSTGKQMHTGHTGNALLRCSTLSNQALKFDEKLGRTGGEDTEFFFRLHRFGAKIVGCYEAAAFEMIDPARENMLFLLQENKRVGQVFCRVFWPSLSVPQRVVALSLILAKTIIFGFGYIIMLPFGRRFSAYWQLRCCCNLEKFRYLLRGNETILRYCT